MDMVDVLVIGAGPAGLNAALYAARKELTVKVVTTDIGGQMLLTNEIENYLGFPSISGFELADKMERLSCPSHHTRRLLQASPQNIQVRLLPYGS